MGDATSECSFSALHFLFIYVSTETEPSYAASRSQRTTHALNLEEAAREFIANSEHRQCIFGAFF